MSRQQNGNTKPGMKLAEDLLKLGLLLEAKPHVSGDPTSPIRWQISYREFPRLTPAPFATLAAVEAWWCGWATKALAEEEFLRCFQQLCLAANVDGFHDLSEWLLGAKTAQMPTSVRDLFDRLDQALIARPRHWRKQAAALFIEHHKQSPQTLKMKMNQVLCNLFGS
jgi:hypothetical protein